MCLLPSVNNLLDALIIFIILADLASVQAANELLRNWQANKMPKKNWEQRTSALNKSWGSLRPTLLETAVSGYAVGQKKCMKSSENEAVVRCYNCHTHTSLCGECDRLVHKASPFHGRDGLMGGFLKPIPPTVSMDCHGQWVSVGT